MSRTVLVASVSTIVALSISFGHAQDAPRAPAQAVPQSTAAPQRHTLKERLSDKASDDQRVDNCKVPLDRRGPKIRPDSCDHESPPR